MTRAIGACLVVVAVVALRTAPADAQRSNPPYLAQMPSVEQVMRVVQGADPIDTAARQAGVFWRLRSLIDDVALSQRRSDRQRTADETRLSNEYYAAYYNVWQPVEKALASDRPRLFKLQGYTADDDLLDEVLVKTNAASVRAEYGKANAAFRARRVENAELTKQAQVRGEADRARAEQEMRALFEQQQPKPWKRALARCIESGRPESQCFTESAARDSPLASLFLGSPRVAAGLSMSGTYARPGGLTMAFYPDTVTLACQEVAAVGAYAVETRGSEVRITLRAPSTLAGTPFAGHELLAQVVPPTGAANADEWQDQRVSLSLRPDGSLLGARVSPPPGSISVTGRVAVGTGRSATGDTITLYETRTRRCELGALKLAGPASPLASGSTAAPAAMSLAIDLLAGTPNPGATKPPPPGIRVAGHYVGDAGFDIEFHPESAVVSCREAVAARDYSVAVKAGAIAVTIQNDGGPIVLALKPDGTLTGAGRVSVKGRAVSGQDAQGKFVFQPRTDTCTLGGLTPAPRQ